MKAETQEYLLNVVPFVHYPYVGEKVNCPCCGGDAVSILKFDREMKPLHTDLCSECGLFFTNPMPTDGELSKYYRSIYRSAYMGAFDSVPEKHVAKKKKDADRRARLVNSLYESHDNRKTLDFGCGLGELVLSLANLGFDAHGFEPGEIWSQHANSSRIRQGDWEAVQYQAQSFDFISIIHVLEHLRKPLECLRRIEGLLKPDGLLWVEVPDMQAYESKNRKRFHFAHVLGFSRDNLLAACWKCGFYPIREFSKDEIGKRRPQLSFVFRKRRPGDTLDALALDLAGTVKKNQRDYGRFRAVWNAVEGGRRGLRFLGSLGGRRKLD